jgi:hypothetical protein
MRFSHWIYSDTEEHRIDYYYEPFFGYLKVSVDGKPVVRRLLTFSNSLLFQCDFYVGTKPVHKVEIEKERKLFLAGLRPQVHRLYVDGVLEKEYRG